MGKAMDGGLQDVWIESVYSVLPIKNLHSRQVGRISAHQNRVNYYLKSGNVLRISGRKSFNMGKLYGK